MILVFALAACGGDRTMEAPAPPQAPPPAAVAPDEAALTRAKGVVKKAGEELKAEVMAAMQEGGPPNTVKVCATRAPEVYAEIEAETGVKVGRASLRMRNATMPVPDWVQAWLTATGERPFAGLEPSGEVVDGEGGRVARVIVPIEAQPMCLACHGPADTIAPEVQQVLVEKYPQDAATGYQAGDLRGVFWAETPASM